MFNIGFSELVILGIIGLIVIGPEQLPDLARKLAKIINEFKRAKDEFMSPMDDFTREAQRKIEEARNIVNKTVDTTLDKKKDDV